MLLLCKEGHVIVEYRNSELCEFNRFEDFKHLGLVYPYMCIFDQNINSTQPELLMLSFDTKMRLQYKYNSHHAEESVDRKQEKVLALIESYETAVKRLEKDLSSKNELVQILACMALITFKTGIRIGKDVHFNTYKTVGLSTIQKKHVTFSGTQCIMDFVGKKGVQHRYTIKDVSLVTILKRLYNRTSKPDDFLFTVFVNDRHKKLTYADFNEYIRSLIGSSLVSGKDFRTLLANILFLSKFITENNPNLKKRVAESIKYVAEELHNTKAVSKKSYVFTAIMEYITKHGTDKLVNKNPLDALKHIFIQQTK